MQNHFDLFQLPQQFAIDAAALDRAYHEVQHKVHPDRFAHASDSERRVAMQWATRANEAYKVLKNPFRRAAYLCELNGVDLQVESNTAMPAAFLMQQMEWREALDEAKAGKDAVALDRLSGEVHGTRRRQMESIGALLDQQQDFAAAAEGVRQMMFLEKFGDEVAAAIDHLAD